MSIEVEQNENNVSIILSGRLTSSFVQPLNARIKQALQEYGVPNTMTIDSRNVQYLNASVLRAIYYLARFMYVHKRDVTFLGKNGITKDFIELSGLCFVYPYVLA